MASGGDALGDIPKRFFAPLCIQLARKLMRPWRRGRFLPKLAELGGTPFPWRILPCFVEGKGADGCRHTTPIGDLPAAEPSMDDAERGTTRSAEEDPAAEEVARKRHRIQADARSTEALEARASLGGCFLVDRDNWAWRA